MATYAEISPYPHEQFGENGQFYAERLLACAWADRYDVVYEIGSGGGELYPYKPSTGARANGAAIRSWGKMTAGAAGIATYAEARIKVSYSTATAIKISSRWVTEELQPTGQTIPLNPDMLKWQTSGVVLDPTEAPSVFLPGFDYVVTYYHLLSVPAAAYTMMRSSNASAVASWLLGVSFAAETLMYMRPKVVRSFDPGLLNLFKLTYRFGFNPQGWNVYYDVTANIWDGIKNLDGTLIKPHPLANFSLLVP